MKQFYSLDDFQQNPALLEKLMAKFNEVDEKAQKFEAQVKFLDKTFTWCWRFFYASTHHLLFVIQWAYSMQVVYLLS